MARIIPKNTLEEIRQRNDVVDVIGAYLQLKRAGSSFRALCPFHKEKTPSFHVNPQRQIFHCFGCGKGGDVFRFVMDYENVDFATAARVLAQKAGIALEFTDGERREGAEKDRLYKLMDETAKLFHRLLLERPEAAAARAYLKERELDGETAELFRIGYALDRWDAMVLWGESKKFPAALLEAAGLVIRSEREGRGSPFYDRFRNRVMFPIHDELGRTVAFSGRVLQGDAQAAKYVNSPETPLFRKGRVLYALDQARRAILDARQAILCEGQIDCIRCHRAGLTTAVASQGTAITEDHARLLKRYADEVVLVLDADKAGQDAAIRSAEVLLGAGLSIRVAALPPGEDPDTLIRKQGGDAFRAIVDAAKSVLDFQIDVLAARENLQSEAGLMRVAREVLGTISRAGAAVQRDRLIQQAAARLHVSEDALRQDFYSLFGRRTPGAAAPAAEETPPALPPHPPEEVALAELLAAHEEMKPLVKQYLPLEHLTDSICRLLIEQLLAGANEDLIQRLDEEADEVQRLAAQVLAAPPKTAGSEEGPERAAQDLILLLWRKTFERRRAGLQKQLDAAPEAEKETLRLEYSHLSVDINTLRQGWAKAQPLLSL